MEGELASGGGEGSPAIERTRASRSRRVVLVAALCLGSLLVAGVAWITYLAHEITTSIGRLPDPFQAIPTRPAEPTPSEAAGSDAQPVNILLLGSDSRTLSSDPGEWSYGAQRTDTMMLLHIPGDRSGAYVISFPRDSWVTIPGHGDAKLNAAYSYGGMPLLIQTFEQLTDIRIDHVAVANFESFAKLTDALGGVEITVPEDTYDRGELSFEAGTHTMNGEEALRYARQRYGLPGGDFDRIKRQQNWMRAIIGEAVDRDTLSSPTALTALVRSLADSVAVDEGLDLREMTSLALSLRHVDTSSLEFLTIPTKGTGWSPDGLQSIVVVDQDGLADLSQAVIDDELAAYVDKHADELSILGSSVR